MFIAIFSKSSTLINRVPVSFRAQTIFLWDTKIHSNLNFLLYLGLPSGFFPSRFVINILHAYISHPTVGDIFRPLPSTFLNVVTQVMLGKNLTCILWSSSLLVFRHFVTFFVLCKIWGFHSGNYEECLFGGDMAPCRSCVSWRFGGTYRLHIQCKNPWARNQQEQLAADWVTSRKHPAIVVLLH
jgi:hypothetical protein